jgi:hypothetical protein
MRDEGCSVSFSLIIITLATGMHCANYYSIASDPLALYPGPSFKRRRKDLVHTACVCAGGPQKKVG